MVIFSDKVKDLLKQMQDENGKIMITDTMPEDLKEAIDIINKNNTDIDKGFQTIGDVNIDDNDNWGDIEELGSDSSEFTTPIVNDDIIEDNSSSNSLSDLEDIF